MTRSEMKEKVPEAAKRLAGVARAIRQSDRYLETQGAADLTALETTYGELMTAINSSTASDADMAALKAWRTATIAEFTALRNILTERANMLTGKTEVPSA